MDPERFFIPVDPERFFKHNRDFLPQHSAPTQPGLSFGPGCLSCAQPTDHTVTLEGGARFSPEAPRRTQPVPMCQRCVGLQKEAQRAQQRAMATAALVGIPAGMLAAMAARSLGLMDDIGLFVVWSVSTFMITTGTWSVLGRAAARKTQQEGVYQPVALYCFREPRKGDDMEILCLEITNRQQAERFGALNPHAIPLEAWNASYSRQPRAPDDDEA